MATKARINLAAPIYAVLFYGRSKVSPRYFAHRSAARAYAYNAAVRHKSAGASVTAIKTPIAETICEYLVEYGNGTIYTIELCNFPIGALINWSAAGWRSRKQIIAHFNESAIASA